MLIAWKRAFAVGILLLVPSLAGVRAQTGSIESARIKQATLDTLITSRRALYKARWAYLGQLDAQLRDLSSPDAAPSPDGEAPGPEKIAEMVKRSGRRQFLEEERVRTLQSMLELATEISGLQADLRKVRSDLDSAQQVLDGHWQITFMPAGTRGDLFVSQNGTIVNGDYSLENGQSGSLQGTFINNTLYVERIDAKFGKMGRIEGPLSKDRQSVKGTWYNYDPTSGQGMTGAFTLDRVQEDREP